MSQFRLAIWQAELDNKNVTKIQRHNVWLLPKYAGVQVAVGSEESLNQEWSKSAAELPQELGLRAF